MTVATWSTSVDESRPILEMSADTDAIANRTWLSPI